MSIGIECWCIRSSAGKKRIVSGLLVKHIWYTRTRWSRLLRRTRSRNGPRCSQTTLSRSSSTRTAQSSSCTRQMSIKASTRSGTSKKGAYQLCRPKSSTWTSPCTSSLPPSPSTYTCSLTTKTRFASKPQTTKTKKSANYQEAWSDKYYPQ